MDREISNSIFIFDRYGKNKVRLQKVGRGPGEYLVLQDFHYDTNERALGIHCTRRRKLMYYSPEGEYLFEKPLPFHALRAVPLSNRYALFCDYIRNVNSKHKGKLANIMLTNSEKEILSSADFFERDRNMRVIYTSFPDFSKWDEEQYLRVLFVP